MLADVGSVTDSARFFFPDGQLYLFPDGQLYFFSRWSVIFFSRWSVILCSYEPRPTGLNFGEQWGASLSLRSSRTANNSLSFLGDVIAVKGELMYIKKFKLECPVEILKKWRRNYHGVALKSRESSKRSPQFSLEFVIETITP